MLQEPDQFLGCAVGDGGGARLHGGDGVEIGDPARRHGPADRAAVHALQDFETRLHSGQMAPDPAFGKRA